METTINGLTAASAASHCLIVALLSRSLPDDDWRRTLSQISDEAENELSNMAIAGDASGELRQFALGMLEVAINRAGNERAGVRPDLGRPN
jgi:hypothetical protein